MNNNNNNNNNLNIVDPAAGEQNGSTEAAAAAAAAGGLLHQVSMDLDACSPQDIVNYWLSLQVVPATATNDLSLTMKLYTAYAMLQSKLDPPTSFLPTAVLGHIIGFIAEPPELVHNISLVCKEWKNVARQLLPEYQRLELNMYPKSFKPNGPEMVAVLQQPQFSLLLSVVLPRSTILFSESLRAIALACPYLEELDIGPNQSSVIVPVLPMLPRLNTVAVGKAVDTTDDIYELMKAMGERLLEIKIRDHCPGDDMSEVPPAMDHLLARLFERVIERVDDNDVIRIVNRICPNLTAFGYVVFPQNYHPSNSFLTPAGVCDLLTAFPRLQSLVLIGTNTGTSGPARPASIPRIIRANPNLATNLTYFEFHGFPMGYVGYGMTRPVGSTGRGVEPTGQYTGVGHLRIQREQVIQSQMTWVCECGNNSGTVEAPCSCG